MKSPDFKRFFMFGVFLIMGVALLSFIGKDQLGAPIFLAILGVFASIGVFFLFSYFLGMIHMTSLEEGDGFTDKLVAEMDIGVLVTDNSNSILYSNQCYRDMLGITDEEDLVSVETYFSRKPEAANIVYKMASAARNNTTQVEEIRLSEGLIPDEKGARWIRLHSRGMNDDNYSKPLIVWQVSDVTRDRVNQENAFQELQDAIHYLDHAPAGFIASENNGSINYLNATLADWLGVDLTRFEPGQYVLKDFVSSANKALLKKLVKETVAEQTSILDLDMLKRDGTLLPVRLHYRLSASNDGAPGSARMLVINRSAVEGDQDELRDVENRFTRFFNSTPVAIAGVNQDGVIVRTNASFHKMFSNLLSSDDGESTLLYNKMVSKEDNAQIETLFEEALSGKGEIAPIDLSIDPEQKRFVRFYVSPVAESAGGSGKSSSSDEERVIIYAMEVTEQRALEDQFAKGQKMQAVGQLAGGIAHDFNNVLTAIIGFSDLLRGNHSPSDPSFQYIINIEQNANRAASLVRQLLAFSRRQTLRPQVLQMSDVLFNLRMLLDRLAGDQIKLQIKHGRDLWPIKADEAQLEQVIVNLVVNARDAMSNSGKLLIKSKNLTEEKCRKKFNYVEMAPADYVLLEIVDEGTGMSPEVLDKIFEPFFSTKEVGKGTGLGLSMVYGIVKQTGGFIYADSELGKGTTFRVFLPRHILTEDEIAERENATKVVKPEIIKDLTGNSTILLVEDEDAVRSFGTKALSSRGYEVFEAASGVEALEVMEEHGDKIDLVVSDVVMPEMDGPTLLVELRKNYPDLKFIFVSGYAEEAFSKNLPEDEVGNFGFLPKPFSLKALAETVKEMLEKE